MTSGKKSEKKFKFEEALSQLEEIVSRLESGELSLDQMLAEFERGVHLVRDCRQFLNQAQKRLEILLKDQEKVEIKELEEDFTDEDGD